MPCRGRARSSSRARTLAQIDPKPGHPPSAHDMSPPSGHRQAEECRPTRRTVVAGAAAFGSGIAWLAKPALAQATTPQQIIQAAGGEGTRFDPSALVDAARLIARRPFAAPANDLPPPFNSLNYEQYVGIKSLPTSVLWQGENRGFAVEPLHRGFAFTNAVSVFVVEDGTVRRIGYDRSRFEFGRLAIPAQLGDIGFSGIRVHALGRDVAIFQGATFFRALAAGQNFGAMARTLTLRAGEPRGEEFPFFRAFWIERPIAGTGTLIVHGIFDSESTAGVARFTLRPGDVTIIDVEVQLTARVPLDHVGLGGMQATYLFGPQSRRAYGDIRPGVYEVDGLQMATGRGEWIWRPVANHESLQISVFGDENPKAFGLLQRMRNYDAFQDDDQRFELRPSLFVEPLGDWGPGAVHLIEIPNESEVNDNVIAFWRTRTPVPAGGEFSFALRQFWCWAPPERPAIATVTATRTGTGSSPSRRRFFVDFTGDTFGDANVLADIRPQLSARPGSIASVRMIPYRDRKVIRVAFELEAGSETLSELRLLLERQGQPVSETWLYRWTP